MNDLQFYLIKYFPNGAVGEFEGQSVNIVEHFRDRFGVNVKIENDEYLFKYDQILAKWAFPITHQSRGHIYKYAQGWSRISNPWDKFFNQNQGYCSLFDPEVFKKELPSLSIVEKVDGSAIQYFWNGSTWKATTLGMLTSGIVQNTTFTFETLFLNTMGKTHEDFAKIADKNYTVLFEIVSIYNQVVTSYNENQVVLLSIRHTEKGFYKSVSEVEEFHKLLVENGFQVRLPLRKYISELNGVVDLDTFTQWVEIEGAKYIEMFSKCDNAEGFVIYSESYPKSKFKTKKYLMLHSLNSDEKHTINLVIQRYFDGNLDDVFGDLKPNMKLFVETLDHKVKALLNLVKEASIHIHGVEFNSQKEYALTIKKYVPKDFWSFFFTYKEKLKTEDIHDLFKNWLITYHTRFETYFKD